jgi:membrane protein insertase Oxa1/YidC/SpoIIIJ
MFNLSLSNFCGINSLSPNTLIIFIINLVLITLFYFIFYKYIINTENDKNTKKNKSILLFSIIIFLVLFIYLEALPSLNHFSLKHRTCLTLPLVLFIFTITFLWGF